MAQTTDLHHRSLTFAGHSVDLHRNYIAAVAAERPHALDVGGRRVGMLDDDQAEAVAVLIRLAASRLAIGRVEVES